MNGMQRNLTKGDSQFLRSDTQELLDQLELPSLSLNKAGANPSFGAPNFTQAYTANLNQQRPQPSFQVAQSAMIGAGTATGQGIGVGIGIGAGYGRPKSADEVLQAMARQIETLRHAITSINDFFVAYDAHEMRQFESWELQIIFMDSITKDDAESLVRALSGGGFNQAIPYQTLLQMLAQKMPYLQAGFPGKQSVFATKFKSPQTQQHLNQIVTYFRQRGLQPSQAFDQLFHITYITQQEFATLLSNVGLGMLQPYDAGQLFSYFLVSNETKLSKICFVQALKAFEQQPAGHLNTITSMGTASLSIGTLDTNKQSEVLSSLFQAMRNFMFQNNGLSFEGMLQRFSIPFSGLYIERYHMEEMCLRLGLRFSQDDIRVLIGAFDDDRNGKVKTSTFRMRFEGNQTGGTLQTLNSPAIGVNNQWGSLQTPTNPTIQQQNSFHIAVQPIGQQQQQQQNLHPMYRNQVTQPQPTYSGNSFNEGLQGHSMGLNAMPQIGIAQFNQHPLSQPHLQSQSSWGFQMPTFQIQESLQKIRQGLKTCNITNLKRLFSTQLIQGKEAVELQEFMSCLQMPQFNLGQEQVFQVVSQFVIQQQNFGYSHNPKKYIDLERFEQELFAGEQPMLSLVQQQSSSLQSLQKVFASLKQYIMINGGDLLKFFREVDLNQDNFISKAEMKIALEKLGFQGLTDDHLNQIYFFFDENKDGRISYAEVCKQMSDFSNTKAIRDSTHWSFYIFEGIRRACKMYQQSLTQLFGLGQVQIRSPTDKIPISKDQFFQTLVRLNIPLLPSHERQLLELLDADQTQQWQIDFNHFSDLVGLEISPLDLTRVTQDYMSNPFSARSFDGVKKFYRQLYDVMMSRNLTINTLRYCFTTGDYSSSTTITQQEFLQRLRQLDSGNKIDQSLAMNVLQRCTIPSSMNSVNPLIDLQSFLQKVEFELKKYQTIDYIFATLLNTIQKNGITSLAELFQKFDPTGMRQFDKALLKQVLNAIGLQLSDHEYDAVIIEYDTNTFGQKLDFALFEQDFKKYQQGGSHLNLGNYQQNNQYGQLTKYLSNYGGGRDLGAGPSTSTIPSLGSKPLTQHVRSILMKVASNIDQRPELKFTQLLLEHDYSKSGVLSIANFQNITQRALALTSEEASHLVQHYDPQSRQQIRINDLLTDLKELVQDPTKRIDIINLIAEFGGSTSMQASFGGAPGGMAPGNLQRYSKDFEEIMKAILVRKSNTFVFFQGYSSHPSKERLSRNDFRSALQALSLSQMNQMDIDSIFDTLDKTKAGYVEITEIDNSIRKFCISTEQQMQEEIIEKVVRGFNGDDAFILKELVALDKTGRGMLDSPLFVNFLQRNAPQHTPLSTTDLQFLAMKYTNARSMNPNQVDVSIFHSDFRRIRQLKNIQNGVYYPMPAGGMDGGRGAFVNEVNPGYRNPLLPQVSSKNTKTERMGTQPNPYFRINIEQGFLEELAKGTYVREQYVQDYFLTFAQRQTEALQEGDFVRAIQNLGVEWTYPTTKEVFQQLDLASNNGQTRLSVTAQQIDEAVAFGCKRTIDDMHYDILKMISEFCALKAIDLRREVSMYDNMKNRQISVENMKDLLLNKLRLPQLMPFDVVFLSKKYVVTVANQVQYEKMLDDIDQISKGAFAAGGGFGLGTHKQICEYINKAMKLLRLRYDEHFSKVMRTSRDFITKQEVLTGCQQLSLIPDVCQAKDIDSLFNEIDTLNSGKVTLQQLSNYIDKMNSGKTTQQLQEDILTDMAVKAMAKSLTVENIFKTDDPVGKGVVPGQAFSLVLQRMFTVKEIDAKFVALRYFDRNEYVNYRAFINDIQVKMRDPRLNPNAVDAYEQGKTLPGLNMLGNNPSAQHRLKELLQRISNFVFQNRLQLTSAFSQFERGHSSGSISQQQFFQAIDQLALPLQKEEQVFLSETYLNPQARQMGAQRDVNYVRFLEDLKLYAGQGAKPRVQALTQEQQAFFKKLVADMTNKRNTNQIVNSILERDINRSSYLSRQVLLDVFKNCGYNFGAAHQTILFSSMDPNSKGEFNYRQLFEILLGPADAERVLQGGSLAGPSRGSAAAVQFVMPQQTIGASSAIMAQIGKKLIQSNVNYEEEIRKRVGAQAAAQQNPKASEADLLDVFRACRIQLSNDEHIELQAFMTLKKDAQSGLVPILEFLTSIGLPPQTLGLKGASQLPLRILKPAELKMAQDIIFKLRNQLNLTNKKPQDVFEKCKTSMQDLSMPMIKFKLALASEFGALGQQMTDNQIALLTYYLAQEVPGEISFKKLYLAFTLTDRDPPLQQAGSEQIKEYERKLRDQASRGIPLEIIDIKDFMERAGLTIPQIFKTTQKGLISRQEFETQLKDAGFIAKDFNRLVDILDTKGTRQSVSLDKLNDYLRRQQPGGRNITPQMARDRFQGFDPKVRQYLQKISDYMKRNNISLQKMYEDLDVNRDGTVDKQEFVSRFSYLNVPGIQLSDLGLIFDSIDINNDGTLSVNEFGMFIEGAKMNRQERLQDIDPKIIEQMGREVQSLFSQFDENGDGFVTADEIYKAMMAIGNRITLEEAQNMIAQIDRDGDGKLNNLEFTDLMVHKMKEELLAQDDHNEDLRAMFLDADIDHSGTLSLDEIYSVIKKLGSDATIEELVELMNEIDVDRDGQLDIDEFIAFMNMGDEIQFRSANAKNTFLSIKRAKKLNPLDFFKCFKSMPMTFVPSFFSERWVKANKNLPSSVFMPQIDPKTMLYKDMYPILSENITPNQNQRAFQPRLRPLLTELGGQILFEEAQGVPTPQPGQGGFDRSQIVKRAVRVGLYDTAKRDFIINVVQVSALYNAQDAEDIWKFNAWRENGTNPILFKTSSKDDIVKPHIFLIFELVIYVKFGEKIQEISCGWCQLDLALLDRQMTHKLPIKGGSPSGEMLIKDTDVHTNRSGIKYLAKVMGSKITSQLTLSVRPFKQLTEESRFHLDLLPSTCLIQKRLLYFVSGFRNYLGEKLLKESSMSTFKQPEGDVIISTFPKILDNPDLCEHLIAIWSEDVWSTLNARQKLNVDLIMIKTKEFIQKLYPVIYADEFRFQASNTTMSAAGDQYLMRKREELVKSALRYGNPQAKVKVDKPIEMLTSFKPFTVRELEFEVWDTHQAKHDRYLRQYEELGLLNPDNKGGMGGVNPLGAGANPLGPGAFGGLSQQYAPPSSIVGGISNLNVNPLQPVGNYGQNAMVGGQAAYQPRSLDAALNQAFGK